jgi:riboflavin transporter FmnP
VEQKEVDNQIETEIETETQAESAEVAVASTLVAKTYKRKFFTAKNIALLGILSALSVILYNFLSFKLPIFPHFLSFDLSDIPILLAGFMLGPVGGIMVVVVRFLLKLPMSGTMFVGEAADLIIGLTLVVVSSVIYHFKRTKKGAFFGLLFGSLAATGIAVLANRFVLVPFYVELLFRGNWAPLTGVLSTLYGAEVTRENFFTYYLLLATIPFNLLKMSVCGAVTFLLYKRLSWFINSIGSKRGGKKESTGGAD